MNISPNLLESTATTSQLVNLSHEYDVESEVIFSNDVALETIITTTSEAENSLNNDDLRVPFMGQIVEVQDDKCSSSEILQSLGQGHLGMSLSQPGSDSVEGPVKLTDKEINKRQRDRVYKRQQRKNPEYIAKERAKSKQRMKDKRKDPQYRERERKKDRVRRRQVREENTELREREKKRDREYRKQIKNGDKVIKRKSSLNQQTLNSTRVEPEHYVPVENCFQCRESLPNFLNSRDNLVLQNEALLSLQSVVNDNEGYSNSNQCDQYDLSIDS